METPYRADNLTQMPLEHYMGRLQTADAAEVSARLGLEPSDLTHIQIAGGIGGGIDFPNAITIGIFPDLPLEKFSYIGNSSLSGAYAVLLSRQAEEKVRELGSTMTYVELSNEPGYMDEFVSACFLPHTDARLFPSVEV